MRLKNNKKTGQDIRSQKALSGFKFKNLAFNCAP
jgi:hypothetical protein